MELVAEYLEKIELLDEDPFYTQVEDKKALRKAVRDNNKRADRIRAIAKEIEVSYPELKSAFAQLLYHERQSVRSWVAHHILEVMNYDTPIRADALREIERIAAEDDTVNGLGNKMWLQQWYQEHPEDCGLTGKDRP